MKPTTLLTLLFTLFWAQANSQTKLEELNSAYKNNSTAELDAFFHGWNQSIRPISNKEFSNLSDTVKAAYEIFSSFYKTTLDVNTLQDPNQTSDPYPKIPYVFIPNSIRVTIIDKLYYTKQDSDDFIVQKVIREVSSRKDREYYLTKENGRYSQYTHFRFGPNVYNVSEEGKDALYNIRVDDFRPNIKTNKTVIYLRHDYKYSLVDFIGKDIKRIKIGTKDSASYKGESLKRVNFLSNHIKIIPTDLVNLAFPTPPSVDRITFDKEMLYAKVFFEIPDTNGYGGFIYGIALFKRQDNQWVLITAGDRSSYTK